MLIASDTVDPSVEAITLPNGEKSLCHRNLAIVKYFVENHSLHNWEWMFMGDDDTILGVAKILDLIQCYEKYSGSRYGTSFSQIESRSLKQEEIF